MFPAKEAWPKQCTMVAEGFLVYKLGNVCTVQIAHAKAVHGKDVDFVVDEPIPRALPAIEEPPYCLVTNPAFVLLELRKICAEVIAAPTDGLHRSEQNATQLRTQWQRQPLQTTLSLEF